MAVKEISVKKYVVRLSGEERERLGLEPILVLFMGVEVVEDDVKLAVRKSRGDTVHEVEKLDAATAF